MTKCLPLLVVWVMTANELRSEIIQFQVNWHLTCMLLWSAVTSHSVMCPEQAITHAISSHQVSK